MLGAIFLAAAVGSLPAASIEVQLNARVITASDLSAAAPKDDQIVGTLAPDSDAVRLTISEQQRLLRNRYPGLALPLRHDTDVLFLAGSDSRATKPGKTCFTTRHEITSGSYLDQEDVAEAPCEADAPRASLGYDRAAAAPYAARTIPAFSYIGALKLPSAKPIKVGQTLTLRTISGPVMIERNVRALQPAKPGQRLFVQTSDGDVLAQRLTDNAAEEDSE